MCRPCVTRRRWAGRHPEGDRAGAKAGERRSGVTPSAAVLGRVLPAPPGPRLGEVSATSADVIVGCGVCW